MAGRFVHDILLRLFEFGGGRYLLEKIDGTSDNEFTKRGMLSQAFAFKFYNGVPGDYFEFGLWYGQSFIIAYRMKHRYRFNDMKLWGFDSFAGLPEIDDSRDNVWHQGEFACSQEELCRMLHRRGVRNDEYELIAGYYNESLNDPTHNIIDGRKAAIVYIDCDLYSSTKLVLNFIRPYLINGTVICFDDYYSYKGNPEQGEQRALSEFLHENNVFAFIPWRDYSPLGKSFIVRLRQDGEDASSRG